MKHTHGGKREGAGRKPKPPRKLYKRTSITLPPDMLDWLKKQPDGISGTIQKLIEQARQ